MPHCTVRYHVRLVPKAPDAEAMSAIGIFIQEHVPDKVGEPGEMLSRRLSNFHGPAGSAIRAMVTHGDAWHMVVQERLGPLDWDH